MKLISTKLILNNYKMQLIPIELNWQILNKYYGYSNVYYDLYYKNQDISTNFTRQKENIEILNNSYKSRKKNIKHGRNNL